MLRHWIGRGIVVTGVTGLVLVNGSQAFAQATGQVQTKVGVSSGSRLDDLQRLLVLPPEPAPEPRLNIFVVTVGQHEEFDGYTEDAVLDPTGDSILVEGGVAVPEFDVTSGGISLGADYFFANGLLIGASFDYTRAEFDFDSRSPTRVQQDLLGIDPFDPGDSPTFVRAGGLGSPLDREFDEYGGTVAAGYLLSQWTFLLTASYSRRDIETERREFNNAFQFFENEADFSSDNYSVELGAAYRLDIAGGTIQPHASIAYRREEVESYIEDRGRQFEDGPGFLLFTGEFEPVDPDDPAFDPDSDTRRSFNDQTIESIPLTVGVLFGYPLGPEGADATSVFALFNARAGVSYTHDFEDQERTVRAESFNFPQFWVSFEEENRNRDFLTLTGSLEFDVFGLQGAVTYEHDEGFDERERADQLRLQLRMPL